MKLCLLLSFIIFPIISCGTVVNPENSPTTVTSDAVVKEAPTIAPVQPEALPEAKNYLGIIDSNSYKNFVGKYNSIKANSDEQKIAQLILDLRKKDAVNEIKSLLPRILPLVTNHKHFEYYTPWLTELTSLANKKLILERIEHCESRWKNNNTTVFENHLELICHQSMKDYIIAKAGSFPETWDVARIWNYLKRKPVFYFSSGENVVVVKKAILALSKENQTALMNNFAEIILPKEISPHSAMTQLLISISPLGSATLLDLNARKQQRRELSHELGTIYSTGGNEVEANYYDSVTNDLIQTTLTKKLTLGEEFITPRLIVFADFLTRNSRQDLSRVVLNHVKNNFKISEVDFTDFHFNYIWSYLTLQDFKSATQYAEKNSLCNNFEDLDSKLQYWIAHSYNSQKNHSKGIKYFTDLVNVNPMTYYSIMAMKNIKAYDDKAYQKLVVANFGVKKELLEPLKNWHETFKSNFIRLSAWAKLGSYHMISQEYNFLLDAIEAEISPLNNSDKLLARSQILHGAAILFNSNTSFLSTFRFMGQAIQQRKVSVDFNFIQTLFPAPFDHLIKNNSYDVDHILISGLTRQESGFDPRAKSAVGATGLMQLMPYTARMVDRKLASNLTSPNNNVSIGIRYLKKLLDKYNNNLVFSLAAYNAGDHRVNGWMKSYFKHDSILYNIESIPFAETRNYVKLIFRNMFFYKLVEEHDIKDSHAFNQLFNIQIGFNQ